jgi:hypothetical protein
MAKNDRNTKVNKDLKASIPNGITAPINDGMNTLVPDKTVKPAPSKSEKALLKQAGNPLGDPDKI